MSKLDSKERFSDRVDNYMLFRPSYPSEAIDFIVKECALTSDSQIADIGSGTGKFTQQLLERELAVYAVEPNENMRKAADKSLAQCAGFQSVDASAENTPLPESSIDLITAAQAFHWFNREVCKREWRRILKPEGKIALIWNRREKSPGFMADYENAIQQWCAEQPNVTHDKITADVFDDFFDSNYTISNFSWQQIFDFDGLWGRAQSSSYSPPPEHPNHEPLKTALQNLFTRYQSDGVVAFTYKTEIIIGKL